MLMVAPGVLAPKVRVMPSSGWTLMTSWLGSSLSMGVFRNSENGGRRNITTISETRLGSALPTRR